MSKTRPPYAAAFRQQMVELVRSGRTPGDLAREFEPSAQAIRTWVAQADRDTGTRTDGLRTEEREEVRQLRREVRRLREERDILAKATAWFARVSPYRCRTVTTRAANQQRFCAGSHSAASRSTFSWRFTRGPASVRFSRSVAKRCLVASPALAASSVDSRPPRPVGRREDGRQVSRTSSVRPDRPGRIRFAGQPDAEPSRRDRHQDARGADGHPGRSRSTRRGADCRGARRV